MADKTKYNSKKVTYQGITFDSRDEMLFYQYLQGQQKDGGIVGYIDLQPKFTLIPKFVYQGIKRRETTYTADFMVTNSQGNIIIYDVKGFSTQQGDIRRKLFEYQFPDLTLIWVSKNKKYGTNGWIYYDDLKKCRAKAKKEKNNENS